LAAIGREVPPLGERLALMADNAPVDAIASVPYGWRTAATQPGVFRLGDQAGVIDSLAGEGVGLALASGTSAARHFLQGGADAAQVYQARFAGHARRPIAIAQLVKAVAERPALAGVAAGIARRSPWLIDRLARLTRIDDSDH
ncbi:MAG: FAD-binding monooxygenase, partial [Sphingomonadaceae bacterium]|nr:FAD-binding monooxygenase [Sphingomonadaceae bacterium]